LISDKSAYNPEMLIPESQRDGWTLGYVGLPWPGPWPKRNGDLFVADSDGWQAGIAWESQGPDIQTIAGQSEGRWGVFQVRFRIPVMSERDLVRNFHEVLPLLQAEQKKLRK
jgi:hypothetical protein